MRVGATATATDILADDALHAAVGGFDLHAASQSPRVIARGSSTCADTFCGHRSPRTPSSERPTGTSCCDSGGGGETARGRCGLPRRSCSKSSQR